MPILRSVGASPTGAGLNRQTASPAGAGLNRQTACGAPACGSAERRIGRCQSHSRIFWVLQRVRPGACHPAALRKRGEDVTWLRPSSQSFAPPRQVATIIDSHARKKSPRKGCVPGGRRTLTFPGAIGRFRAGPAQRRRVPGTRRDNGQFTVFEANRPLPCRRRLASRSAGKPFSRPSPCGPTCVDR